MFQEFEDEVAALERKYADKPTGNIVFYGSSSIRLWPGLSRAFPGVSIENWGFGGSTLAACAYYFERLIIPRAPRGLVLYAGDNDIALGATPEQVWEALVQLLDSRDQLLPAVPLVCLSLKPSPARQHLSHLISEANEWCQREILARDEAQWADVHNPMLENNAPRPELFMKDELHLSRAGYDLWNEIVRRDVSWLS